VIKLLVGGLAMNVGDKVKIIDKPGLYEGRTGVITGTHTMDISNRLDKPIMHKVKFDDTGEDTEFFEGELEKVE